MARIIDVVSNKLQVGYNFVESYYYVIHRDTETTRLSATEAFEIVGVISPESATEELMDQINALAITIEYLEDIYIALEDTGLGVKALWFNTYKEYALVYDGNTLAIRGSDIVYPIAYYTVKNKIVNGVQNFFLKKIGLEISYEDLSIIYDYLISTSYRKPVYNNIAPRESEDDNYLYSNTIQTLDKSKVAYVATYNPNEEYTYDTAVGGIESVDVLNNRIIMDDVYSNMSRVKRAKVVGTTLYIEGEEYTDDGIYNITSVGSKILQDKDFTWHNGNKYSHAYSSLVDKYNSSTSTEVSEHLTSIPDFRVLGTNVVIDSNGYASGFDDYASYLVSPNFVYFTGAFEIATKFRLTQLGVISTIIGSGDNYGVIIRVGANNKFYLYASSNKSSWNLINGTQGSLVLSLNTDYWIKFTFDGTSYVLSYSTDGINYINDIVISSPNNYMCGTQLAIGHYSIENNSQLRGGVYLKDTYVKNNGEMIWSPYPYITYKHSTDNMKIIDSKYLGSISSLRDKNGGYSDFYVIDQENKQFKIPSSPVDTDLPSKLVTNTTLAVEEEINYNYDATSNIDNIDSSTNTITLTSTYTARELKQGDRFTLKNSKGKVFNSIWGYRYGTLSVDPNCIASGFSSTSYVDVPATRFGEQGYTWEIGTKVTFSGFPVTQDIFGTKNNSYPLILGFTNAAKSRFYVSSNLSSWNVLDNKQGIYVYQPNTTYWIRIRFTGNAYTWEYSLNGVDYMIDINVASTVGIHPNIKNILRLGAQGTGEPILYCSMDLNSTYIKVDGKEEWRGCYLKDYNSDGTYTIDSVYQDGYKTAIKTFEQPKQSYTAPLSGPFPEFIPEGNPEIYSGTPNDSILLNVTKSSVPDRFPKGEFLLDNSDQLTEYIETANTHCNYLIPVPNQDNYNSFNAEIPSTIEVTGLSKPLQFKGLYSELF